MKKIICYIAGLGLIFGLIIHIISLFGIYIGDKIPFIWALHIGVFIVWLPAILELRKNPVLKSQNFGTITSSLKFFGIIFKDTPKPIMILSVVFFVYATINSFLFIPSVGRMPGIVDGKYVILDHGTIISNLSEAEYFKLKANEILLFSGYWIGLYGLAMGILWPKIDKQ